MLTNNELKIYYMRDNHTFVPLKGSVQDMIDQCVHEMYINNYSHGSLFCKVDGTTVLSVHSNGLENLAKFIEEAKVKLTEMMV